MTNTSWWQRGFDPIRLPGMHQKMTPSMPIFPDFVVRASRAMCLTPRGVKVAHSTISTENPSGKLTL